MNTLAGTKITQIIQLTGEDTCILKIDIQWICEINGKQIISYIPKTCIQNRHTAEDTGQTTCILTIGIQLTGENTGQTKL